MYVDRGLLSWICDGRLTFQEVLHAKDRAETKERLGTKVKEDGPYDALIIKMGTVCTRSESMPLHDRTIGLSECNRSHMNHTTKTSSVQSLPGAKSSPHAQQATTSSMSTG